jgi:hypothetical protein
VQPSADGHVSTDRQRTAGSTDASVMARLAGCLDAYLGAKPGYEPTA